MNKRTEAVAVAPAFNPADGTDYRRDTAHHVPSLAASLIVSLGIAFVLLYAIISTAGAWDLVAVTRLLDLLIEGGVVQYHDMNPGFIQGIPDLAYYYMSQDPIDWRLVLIAALVMMIYPVLKAIQFHLIASIYGSTASLGDHVRGYFYGDGIDRFLPFNLGRVALANVLMKFGLPEGRAAGAAFVSLAFTVFEVAAFAVVGLFLLGWVPWFSQMVWALVALAVAYYLVARKGYMTVVPPPREAVRAALSGFFLIAQRRPLQFVQLCLLSLCAFGAFDIAVYILMMAFDTGVVLINVETPLLLMGIVGGYIAARLVPITPGGVGQWEIGFATGLHLGGADVSLALVSVAILANLLRILTGTLLMGMVMLRYGVPTNLREIFVAFTRRPRPVLAWSQDDAELDSAGRPVAGLKGETV